MYLVPKNWAVLGLMAAGEENSSAVHSGIEFLINTQGEDGFWKDEYFTAAGFPRHYAST